MSKINWDLLGEDKSVAISVRLDAGDVAKIGELAKKYGLKQGTIVRTIVREYFKQNND